VRSSLAAITRLCRRGSADQWAALSPERERLVDVAAETRTEAAAGRPGSAPRPYAALETA
jgi:hypothetical protein